VPVPVPVPLPALSTIDRCAVRRPSAVSSTPRYPRVVSLSACRKVEVAVSRRNVAAAASVRLRAPASAVFVAASWRPPVNDTDSWRSTWSRSMSAVAGWPAD